MKGRRVGRGLVVFLMCAGLPGACSSTERSNSSGVERRRAGDTLTVHNLRPAAEGTVRLELVRSYGSVEGEPETSLYKVLAFAVGPNGDVYTYQPKEGIQRFRADGTYGGLVARLGQGPAEVYGVVGMSVGRDGSVAAYDLGNSRVKIFHPQGRVTSFARPAGMPLSYSETTIAFHGDGSLWVGLVPPLDDDLRVTFPRPIYARIDSSGALEDTVWAESRFQVGCPTLDTIGARVGFYPDQRAPYVPKVTWAMSPRGAVAVGCPRTYSFDVSGWAPGVLRISRAWTPVHASSAERRFLEQKVIQVPVDLPEERPAYARIIFPGDGRVWVWPNQPSVLSTVPPQVAARTGVKHTWDLASKGAFDVFAHDGRWLGRVALPKGVRYSGYPTEQPVVIRGDTLWAVTFDSLDVERISRYRLEWPR